MSDMHVGQVPVDATKAGLYQWTMTTNAGKRSGHVVVRGTQAAPIGNFNYAQGSETWYWGAPSAPGGTPFYTLMLSLHRAPADPALVAAVTNVRSTETSAGAAAMVPAWQAGAPLGTSPSVVTLTNVVSGSGSYSSLFKNISFQMPISGNPLLPTW